VSDEPEWDEVMREYENDPMGAIVIRLAAIIGTAQSVIDDLKEHDYEIDAHTLKMLMTNIENQVIKTDEVMALWTIMSGGDDNEDQ